MAEPKRFLDTIDDSLREKQRKGQMYLGGIDDS